MHNAVPRLPEAAKGRVELRQGNICEPNLGLSSDENLNVDTVIHAAAYVNHLKSYDELFDAKRVVSRSFPASA